MEKRIEFKFESDFGLAYETGILQTQNSTIQKLSLSQCFKIGVLS